ncbi:hypothetical protein XHV734_4083 [Xanthomonas hortorum pv. vitians]|nr:hypothetical protein XHV734_4083 [Xanthomonas hortorum pv. vitians]
MPTHLHIVVLLPCAVRPDDWCVGLSPQGNAPCGESSLDKTDAALGAATVRLIPGIYRRVAAARIFEEVSPVVVCLAYWHRTFRHDQRDDRQVCVPGKR